MFAIIEDDVVVNIVLAHSIEAVPLLDNQECIPLPDGVKIGWCWDGSAFSDPTPVAEPPPPTVPQTISRTQLLLGLLKSRQITAEEAESASAIGAIPAALAPIVESLGEVERSEFKVIWASMTEVQRNHPLINTIINANGMTDAEVDEFFRFCSTLS